LLVTLVLLSFSGLPSRLSQAQESGQRGKETAKELKDRARRAYAEKRWEEAIELYLRLSQLTGAVSRPGLLFNIGYAYMQLGKKQEALRYFEMFLTVDPHSLSDNAARAYAEAQKYAQQLRTELGQQQDEAPPPEVAGAEPSDTSIGASGSADLDEREYPSALIDLPLGLPRREVEAELGACVALGRVTGPGTDLRARAGFGLFNAYAGANLRMIDTGDTEPPYFDPDSMQLVYLGLVFVPTQSFTLGVEVGAYDVGADFMVMRYRGITALRSRLASRVALRLEGVVGFLNYVDEAASSSEPRFDEFAQLTSALQLQLGKRLALEGFGGVSGALTHESCRRADEVTRDIDCYGDPRVSAGTLLRYGASRTEFDVGLSGTTVEGEWAAQLLVGFRHGWKRE